MHKRSSLRTGEGDKHGRKEIRERKIFLSIVGQEDLSLVKCSVSLGTKLKSLHVSGMKKTHNSIN